MAKSQYWRGEEAISLLLPPSVRPVPPIEAAAFAGVWLTVDEALPELSPIHPGIAKAPSVK